MLFVDKPLLPETLRDPAIQVIDRVKSKIILLSSNVRNMLMSLLGKADEVISSVGSKDNGFESIPKLENDADLEDALSKSSRLLVMAHAPWCGHCKRMHKDMYELFSDIKEDPLKYPADQIAIFTYDASKKCDKGPECSVTKIKEVVRGFPTIVMVDKHGVEQYEGGRTAPAMKEFIADQLVPLSVTSSIEALKKVTDRDKFSLVHYLPNSITLETASARSKGFPKSQTVFVRSSELMNSLALPFSSDKHEMFLVKAGKFERKLPNIEEVSVNVLLTIFEHNGVSDFSGRQINSKLPRFYIMINPKPNTSADQVDKIRTYFSKVVQTEGVLGHFFAFLLGSSDNDQKIARALDMSASKLLDTVTVYDTQTNSRYGISMPSAYAWKSNPEDLSNYFKSIKNGNSEQTGDLNYDSKENVVKVVTEKNIDQVVAKYKKVLLLTFSALNDGIKSFTDFIAINLEDTVLAVADFSMGKKLKTEKVDISSAAKYKIYYFVDGVQTPGSFDKDITNEAITTFVQAETALNNKAKTTEDL